MFNNQRFNNVTYDRATVGTPLTASIVGSGHTSLNSKVLNNLSFNLSGTSSASQWGVNVKVQIIPDPIIGEGDAMLSALAYFLLYF